MFEMNGKRGEENKKNEEKGEEDPIMGEEMKRP